MALTLNTNVINLYITIHFIYLIRILLLEKKFYKIFKMEKKKNEKKNFLYNRIALGSGPGNFLRLKCWNVFFEKIYFFYMNTAYIRILIITFLIFLTYFLYLNELNPLFFFLLKWNKCCVSTILPLCFFFFYFRIIL